MASKKVDTSIAIAGMIVTLIVGGVLGPWATSYFNELSNPKPDLYIKKESCSIIPLHGTSTIACKLLMANKGNSVENDVHFNIRLKDPYRVVNSTGVELQFFKTTKVNVVGGETIMFTFPIINKNDKELNHGEIELELKLYGGQKVWDEYIFNYKW